MRAQYHTVLSVTISIAVVILQTQYSEADISLATYHSGTSDILSRSPDVINDVMKSSKIPYGSLVLMVNGRTQYNVVQNFAWNIGNDTSFGIFEASINQLKDENGRTPKLIHEVKTILRSASGLTILLASDDLPFLLAAVNQLYRNLLLQWSTRLLLLTRLPTQELTPLKKRLSETNSMVITCRMGSARKRCDVVSYQPYSLVDIQLATWTDTQGLIYQAKGSLFPEKFDRFNEDAHLFVTGEQFTPYIEVELLPGIREDGEQDFTFHGPMRKMLNFLSDTMNFTYTLKRSSDRTWGYVLPNGTVTGMVGLLARKEVDLFLGPLAMILNRAPVITYTTPIILDMMAILAANGDTTIDVWAFVNPLTLPVWLGVGLCLAGAVLSAKSLSVMTGNGIHNKPFIYIYILLQQSVETPRNRWWERLLICGWMICMTVIFLSYKGNLMSQLAVRYISQPFHTLKAVLADTSIVTIWEANTAHVLNYRTATSGEMMRVNEAEADGRVRFVLPTESYLDMMKTLVMAGDHVLLLEEISLKLLIAAHFTATGTCNFYVSRGQFDPSLAVMAVQKGNPLSEPINKRISALKENGIFVQWLKTEVQNSTTCLNAPTKKVVMSSLAIDNIWGIFMILVMGDTISFVILILEVLSSKLQKTATDAGDFT